MCEGTLVSPQVSSPPSNTMLTDCNFFGLLPNEEHHITIHNRDLQSEGATELQLKVNASLCTRKETFYTRNSMDKIFM